MHHCMQHTKYAPLQIVLQLLRWVLCLHGCICYSLPSSPPSSVWRLASKGDSVSVVTRPGVRLWPLYCILCCNAKKVVNLDNHPSNGESDIWLVWCPAICFSLESDMYFMTTAHNHRVHTTSVCREDLAIRCKIVLSSAILIYEKWAILIAGTFRLWADVCESICARQGWKPERNQILPMIK